MKQTQDFMKKVFYIISLILMVCLVHSCKTTKNATKTPKKPVTTKDTVSKWESIKQNSEKQSFKYDNLILSGKMYAEMPKQGMNGMTVNYRAHLKKDSMIWLKISLLGIEGMRALITPDTIKILDRQSNVAHIAPFSRVKQFLGLEVNFQHLQQLMVGNLPAICESMQIKEEGRMSYITECQKDSFKFLYNIQRESYRLENVYSEKSNPKINVNINYTDFMPEGTQLFAHQVDMELFSEKEGKNTVSLTHSKVEVNPAEISFAFSIPANFKIVND